MSHWILHSLRVRILHIPITLRYISSGLFVFLVGRGVWGDTFFSLYMKSIVWSVVTVSLLGSLLAACRIFFAIPIWTVLSQFSAKFLLYIAKTAYIFGWFAYFAAGYRSFMPALYIALILNSLWSAILFIVYQSYVRDASHAYNTASRFGIFFSSINAWLIVGALIASVLVQYVDLPWLFLGISIAALCSLVWDIALRKVRLSVVQDSASLWSLDGKKITAGITSTYQKLRLFFRTIFSFRAHAHTYFHFFQLSSKIKRVLWLYMFVYMLDYIAFIFIPLLSAERSLSLSQIAIVFAIMRIPYAASVYSSQLWDKYKKSVVVSLLFFLTAWLFVTLGLIQWFFPILLVSFWIACMIATARPIVAGMITDVSSHAQRWIVTPFQEISSRVWESLSALLFGQLVYFLGMKFALIALAGVTVFIAIFILAKKS